MDILMLTSDVTALRQGSSFEKRLLEYAPLCKHFVVIVLNDRRERYARRRVANNVWIIPVNAPLRLLTPFYAVAEATRQLFFQGKLQTDLIDARDAALAGLAAWLIARRFKKPLTLSLPENAISRAYGSRSLRHWAGMLLARFLVPAADALSTDSETTRAALGAISQSVGDRTVLLPRVLDSGEGASTEVMRPLSATYPQFKFVLLNVSPLSPEYNVRLSITVLAGVLRVYPYAGLVIVGTGSERRRLETFARRIGVAGHVVFERPVGDLAPYLSSAHVLLQTAPEAENDDVIAQAARSGCVVVSTRVGLAPLLIEDRRSGFLCEAADPACFVSAITDMIHDPSIRERARINLILSAGKYLDRSTPESRAQAMRQVWELAIANFRALSGGSLTP